MDESRRLQDIQEDNRTTSRDVEEETAAERRRRLAALGISSASEQEDSEYDDDDYQNEPQIPAPKKKGIRFAQSPRDSVSLLSAEVFLRYPTLANLILDEQPAELYESFSTPRPS